MFWINVKMGFYACSCKDCGNNSVYEAMCQKPIWIQSFKKLMRLIPKRVLQDFAHILKIPDIDF